jgi:amino-acid N-acetyltransferase
MPSLDFIFQEATEQDRIALVQLLSSLQLPTEDLPASLASFLVVRGEGGLVASGGLEYHSPFALLRSLAVIPSLQGKGIGQALALRLLGNAWQQGISSVYLLTTTASCFFEKLGFDRVERTQVPEPVRQTSQFGSTCPASATVMYVKKE